jgi:hypothetical protein
MPSTPIKIIEKVQHYAVCCQGEIGTEFTELGLFQVRLRFWLLVINVGNLSEIIIYRKVLEDGMVPN